MERRLAAILAADVAGYSRLIGMDEAGTLSALKAHREELIEPKIAEHNGRIVKLMGDGLLAEFSSAVEAVQCAVQIQHVMAERNAPVPEDRRITFRVGINIGDIVVEGDDIYGDGVNVAARLEGLAEPGGVCVRRNVRNQVRDKLDISFEDLGEVEVKNIARPIRAFRVVLDAKSAAFVTPVTPTRATSKSRFSLVGAAGLVALLVAAGGVIWWRPWMPDVEPASITKMALPLPEQPSIAVLPFDNFSNDPEQDFLADGLTEEIITSLSKTPELFVIARNSTFIYKDKAVPVRQVAEEQGVRYVLEGSVQRSGERIRINAQLIDALEGNHIWAERYDREFKDLFSLQDDITHNVAVALQVNLTLGDEVSSRRQGTSSPEAFQLAHKALWHIQQYNKEDTAKARELVKKAQKIAPDALFPLQMEGWVHLNDSRFGYSASREDSLAKAEAIAQRALLIDANDPDSHLLLAGVERGRKNLDQAIRHMERAIELNPNHAKAVGAMAQLLNYSGRPKEAIAFSKKAMRLSPVYPPWMPANLGLSYMMIGEYEKAIAAYEEVLSRGAFIVFGYERLVAIHALKGDLDKAREYAGKLLEAKPDFTIEEWSNVLLYTNKEDLDRELNALRAAGLPEHPPLALPAKPSIAVLAFNDLSQGADRDYLSDAIAEGIITELSRFPELFVIARNSSFHYRDTATDVRDIARELGVRYILEGSQQKAGERLRVTVQLIDAVAGNHIWAETYDRDLADIFLVQDAISNTVASTLGEKLLRIAGEEAKRADPKRLRAFEHWLIGVRHFREFTQVGSEKARLSYLKAIEADPNLARGHSGLTWVYINGYRWGWTELDRDEALVRAREHAQIALDLAPDDYSPHFALASVHMQAGERELAIAEFEKTLQLVPNGGTVMANLAEALTYAGRTSEAVELMQKAMRLDPHHEEWWYWNLGWAQYFAGDCEKALATMRKMSRMPKLANRTLAASLVCLGQLDEARTAIAELLKDDPEYSVAKLRLNLKDKFKDPALPERFINDLREAGLPE